MAKKKKKKTALAAALEKMAKKSAQNKKAKKQVVQNKPEKKNKVEVAKKAVKKSGVVISEKSAQKKREEKKKTNRVEATKKAIEKGQQRSALGTKVEKKTGTVKVQGENGKTEKVKYEYTPMTMQEYGQLEVGARTGQLQKTLKSNKDLNKKVTDLNVKDYAKSPGVMGALDQMTQGLSVSEDPTYKYSESQKKIIDSQKKTGKYNVGRAVGAVAEFGLGGTGTVGSSIAKTAGKTVLKEAAEQGGKKLAKQTAKNIAKETAGDTVASLGLNTLDAVKFSYEDGKLNKEKFAKELALNIGGDILIGGAVSGITHGLSAKQVANFNRISKKKAKGEAVSEAEQKFYDKHLGEFTSKVQTRLRQLKEEDAKKAVDKPVDKTEKAVANEPDVMYNTHTGGSKNESEQVWTDNISDVSGRGNDIRQTDEGISAGSGYDRSRTGEETRTEELGTVGGRDNISVLTAEQRNRMNNSGIVDTHLEKSDYAIFSTQLDKGKSSNKYGAYVDGQSVEDLQKANAKTFLSDDGSIGVAVKSDGDICGAFNSGTKYKGAVKDLLITARANGGTKMDCYGLQLVNKYESVGYVPVARIPFNADYVDDALLLKNRPDVYVLMKNTDTIDDVIDKAARNAYTKSLPDDLEKLPAFEDYDEALAYRDELLAKQESKGSDAEWEATSTQAAENPGKQYDTAKERIFDENKSPEEWLEKSKRIEDDELPRARQTAKKLVNQADDDIADILEPWVRDGYYNKKVLQSQEKARVKALAELNDGTLYRNFMDSKVETDEHLFMARAEALLNSLMKKAPESDDAAMKLLEVMDKATDASSHAGRLLNATKMLLRNTPEGRIRMFSKEIDRLNNKFKGVLKDKKLELTPEQIKRIANATEENIEEVADEINKEIWEDIPATWFEKFNEMRHASMLFNLKTHGRNVLGNSVFWGGRLISDGIEIAAYKVPAVKKRLEKLNGNVQMVHVTRKELADNKETINKIFDSFYKKSDSQNKFVESTRPDGMTAVKNKPMSKFIQTNYKLLEAEDMIAFKPEYRKNFIRWCKTHKVDDISKMSQKQIREANMYAMSRAERATFRDDSAFARKIVGWKNTTATKTGKTPVGTAAYRVGNVALESSLPFVKTPVNILRRSVDYSPIGLARGAAELITAKSADAFMEGVTHLASGLTGSGVFALGIWLANKDLIMVKAGEESGDAYYDRDMGYQDYSLVLGGDKEYSITIDWLSPMQVSLFMGANAFNNLSDGDLTFEDMLDGVLAISGPMLDMSFMSSTKDTIQTFMEKVYRNGTGEDADWSGAITKTLFGSVPQGYLSGFVPQIMSQTATAFDSKQRDTRSTKEDPIAASWDSFAKKLANKIPVLRNKVLNPKIDRFGEDVTTGNNIVTRLLNAYANPSTVKQIKRTDLDNEIIDIYNHMKDGDNKKYFFYKFTGNPDYDLGDGKRMTYNEAYKYGKESRQQQTNMLESMINSVRYKSMTYDMKAKEVSDSHDIGNVYADKKTYNNKFAADRIAEASKTDGRAREKLKKIGGNDKAFVDYYINKEKLLAQSHDSSKQTNAIAVCKYGDKLISKAYSISGDYLKTAKKYFESGGSTKEYTNSMCEVISTINKNGATKSLVNKAVAAAYSNIKERTYYAMGISEQQANMGAGLKKMGYTFEALQAMEAEALLGFDSDNNNSLKKGEIINYVESLGLDSNEEKACVFAYLSDAKNPYGGIPNYLGFKSTDSSGSGSGSGRGSGKKKSSSLPSWEEWVKDYMANNPVESEQPKVEAYVNPVSWEDYVQDYISKERSGGGTVKANKGNTGTSYQKKISSIIDKMEV